MPTSLKTLNLEQAVNWLRQGKLLAYPTEAVYGLGCDPWNEQAVTRLAQLKQRSLNKGFILIASNFAQIEPFIETIPKIALNNVLATWPGPTTWLFPAKSNVPQWLRGHSNNIALRITAHPLAQALCEQYGGAIVSTSANLHASPPARTSQEIHFTDHEIELAVLPGPVGTLANPTQIRDAISGDIIRPG